jgi:hypothetical protein
MLSIGARSAPNEPTGPSLAAPNGTNRLDLTYPMWGHYISTPHTPSHARVSLATPPP